MSKLSEYCKKKNLRPMDIEYLLLYRICLCILPRVIGIVIFMLIFGNKIVDSGAVCAFKSHTGLYCLGCGGTRALNAFVHLHFIKSLYYHPIVVFFFVGYFFFIINSFLFRHNKICFAKFNPLILIYVGLTIAVLNLIVRNVLLIMGHPTL